MTAPYHVRLPRRAFLRSRGPLCYASSWLGLILTFVTTAALLVASRGTSQ